MSSRYRTIKQTAELLDSGKISALELAQEYITQANALEPDIHAFVTLTEEHAHVQAKESDDRKAKNQTRGVLDGVSGALKDVIATRGIISTASSKILEQFKPPYNAFVTDKLYDAGMVLVGKTNLDEFAMGTTTEYSAFGPTKNPWNLKHTAGGSSGGSAASVAAGEAVFALGTDTGGSIRLPAAWCGVVGLRPTYGRVSRNGVFAMASSLDQVGTFTLTVEDAAILLNHLAVHDPADSTSVAEQAPDYTKALRTDLQGMNIGVVKQFMGEGIDPHIRHAVEEAMVVLQKRGARVTEVSLPLAEAALATYCIIVPAEVSTNLERYDGIKYGYSARDESSVHNLLDVYLESRAHGFGAEAKRRIMLGSYVLSAGYYDAYYTKAQKVRALIQKQFAETFKQFDCLIGPVSPTNAFELGSTTNDPLKTWMADVLAVPVNIAGLPGMSVPCGIHDGLPIGLQIIADQFEEEKMFTVAHAFEQATEWHQKHPLMDGMTNN